MLARLRRAIAQDLLEKAQRGFVVDDTGDRLIYASDPELPVDAEFLVDEGALRQQRLRRGLAIVGAFLVALLAKTSVATMPAVLLAVAVPCAGQGVFVGPDGKSEPRTLRLPYAFYNENFGFAGGFVYGKVGKPQKQAFMLATGIVGTKGGMGFLVGRDIQMPLIDRLFLDPTVSVGYFSDNESYIDGNPDFPDERAGSNDSDEDNFVEGDGWDNFFRLKFKYLLPIGNGRDDIITTVKIKDGIPISEPKGGTSLNPFKSGRSFLEMRPFYRSQELEGDDIDTTVKTNGVDFSVFWARAIAIIFLLISGFWPASSASRGSTDRRRSTASSIWRA